MSSNNISSFLLVILAHALILQSKLLRCDSFSINHFSQHDLLRMKRTSFTLSSSLYMSTTTKQDTDSKITVTSDSKSSMFGRKRKAFSKIRISNKKITDSDGSNTNQNVLESSKQMKFIGIKRVETKPILLPFMQKSKQQKHQHQFMNEFFMNETNRNLLFPDNNARTINLQSLKKDNPHYYNELLLKWDQEAQLGGGFGPSTKIVNDNTIDNDGEGGKQDDIISIFQIDALLQMPGGLKIISESTIGMKLILSNDNNDHDHYHNNEKTITEQRQRIQMKYPEYQFTLLDSNLIPHGPKPLVWLFEKLTKYRDSTSSFTKVRMEHVPSSSLFSKEKFHTNNNDYDSIIFVTDARLETRMHLPSTLLKMLPNVNIAKFEKQGSEAVQRLLEKELEPALHGFCNSFTLFMNEKMRNTMIERSRE